MIEAVIFDLDDTLAVVDSDRQTILDIATQQAGAPRIERDEYLRAHRDHLTDATREDIFETLYEQTDAEFDPLAVATEYRSEIRDSIRLLPGIREMIMALREEYRVGLLTNGPSNAQEVKIQSLEIADLFDAICISGNLVAGKPDPRSFEAICDRLTVDHESAVYVGDDINIDIAGAHAVGLHTVQVTFDGGPDPTEIADVVLQRAVMTEELPDIISRLD